MSIINIMLIITSILLIIVSSFSIYRDIRDFKLLRERYKQHINSLDLQLRDLILYQLITTEILDFMCDTGGSFIAALSVCYRRADYDNKLKLLSVFYNYFEKYIETYDIQIKKLQQTETTTTEN